MLSKVDAIVIFVQDLGKCVAFYRDTLGFRVTFNDDVSFGFALGSQDFLLLQTTAAAEMVGEAALLPGGVNGSRVLLCAGVENVDSVYEALTDKGIAMLKPPEDKPWGRRTAYFADPEGNLWELFTPL
jgi:catechol 2,3-dioxygenase-like lactoylglutathione lyase family enzyme